MNTNSPSAPKAAKPLIQYTEAERNAAVKPKNVPEYLLALNVRAFWSTVGIFPGVLLGSYMDGPGYVHYLSYGLSIGFVTSYWTSILSVQRTTTLLVLTLFRDWRRKG